MLAWFVLFKWYRQHFREILHWKLLFVLEMTSCLSWDGGSFNSSIVNYMHYQKEDELPKSEFNFPYTVLLTSDLGFCLAEFCFSSPFHFDFSSSPENYHQLKITNYENTNSVFVGRFLQIDLFKKFISVSIVFCQSKNL